MNTNQVKRRRRQMDNGNDGVRSREDKCVRSMLYMDKVSDSNSEHLVAFMFCTVQENHEPLHTDLYP